MQPDAQAAPDTTSPLPPAPEHLQLWLAVGARRAGLVATIEKCETTAADPQQGAHWRRLEARTAATLRDRLAELDRVVSFGARDNASERGLTIRQLRDLLDEESRAAQEDARVAVLAWLKNRDDLTAEWAADAIEWFRYLRCGLCKAVTVGELCALEASARAARSGRTGRLEVLAARIVGPDYRRIPSGSREVTSRPGRS